MLNPPYPELDDLLEMMGQAGRHLSEIEASEVQQNIFKRQK
jgi:uncharacterized protein YneF (UPF0154 family)